MDLDAGVTQLRPAMFSFGHPRMRLPRYPVGERLLVQGMRPEGDWSVILPDVKIALSVRLGDREDLIGMEPDTLCAFPSFNRFFVLARASFVYQFVARRHRVATLRWAEAGTKRIVAPSSLTHREAACDTALLRPEATDSPIPFELMRELYPLRTIVEQLPLMLSS